MVSFDRLISDGGVFVWVTLLVGMVSMAVALIIPSVIGWLRWRIPSSLAWLAIAATVASGTLGTFLGMSQAYQAVGYAPVEMKDTMLAAGASVALYTTIVALWLAAPMALLVCVAAAFPTLATVGPAPRLDLRGALASIGGAVVTGLIAIAVSAAVLGLEGFRYLGFGLLLIPALTLVVTMATVAACTRVASEDRVHQGRIAGARIFVGMSGALAVALAAELLRTNGTTQMMYAAAVASAETKLVLIHMGESIASGGALFGWLFAAVPAVAGFSGAMHWVRRVDGRAGIGSVVALLALAVIFGLIFVAQWYCTSDVATLI